MNVRSGESCAAATGWTVKVWFGPFVSIDTNGG
ncbi:MAG: hypothetical protein ACI8Z0_002752, partial [Lentimonas sp.]